MDQLQLLALMELLNPRRLESGKHRRSGGENGRTHEGGSPPCSGAPRTVLNRTVSPPSRRAEDGESPDTRSGSDFTDSSFSVVSGPVWCQVAGELPWDD